MEQVQSEHNSGSKPKRRGLAIGRPYLYGKMPREMRGTVLVDRRTSIGKAVGNLRVQLTEHIGGHPSVTQRHLIEICCQLQLRLLTMDYAFAEEGEITLLDSRVYLAWTNTLVRTLRALGLARPAKTGPSIDEIVGAIKRQKPSDDDEVDDLAGLDGDE
jgi:hypothetical protein